MLHDLGIAARGKQMTRVVEILKGEGKLVRSMAENIVTYHLEIVEETGITPTSSGLRTIAGCVTLLYTDLELQPSLERLTLHLQDGRRLQVFCKRPGWVVATDGIRND
jgi:hypothetical protein